MANLRAKSASRPAPATAPSAVVPTVAPTGDDLPEQLRAKREKVLARFDSDLKSAQRRLNNLSRQRMPKNYTDPKAWGAGQRAERAEVLHRISWCQARLRAFERLPRAEMEKLFENLDRLETERHEAARKILRAHFATPTAAARTVFDKNPSIQSYRVTREMDQEGMVTHFRVAYYARDGLVRTGTVYLSLRPVDRDLIGPASRPIGYWPESATITYADGRQDTLLVPEVSAPENTILWQAGGFTIGPE